MNDKEISKFLSFVLRHNPGAIGVTLDPEGWVDVDLIIKNSRKPITLQDIERVVRENDKQRFALKDGRIRANQGHSVKGITAFDKTPRVPPRFLYHGTSLDLFDVIRKQGLKPMSRHHVHLSPDLETAWKVAKRRFGKTPIVFEVLALRMTNEGVEFYLSDNGVWLTDKVLPKYFAPKVFIDLDKYYFSPPPDDKEWYRIIIGMFPNLKEEFERTGKISPESILKQGPKVFKSDEDVERLFEDRE